MTRRTERFELRLTPEEKSRLRRKAKRHGMSVADYLRTMALNFENGVIVTIDVTSLESIAHELLKQGTNLNQLMYSLNSYGIEDYNAKEVRRVLDLKETAYLRVSAAIQSLREEALRHHVHVSNGDDLIAEE